MYRTVLLKLLCSFVVLEIVSTQNNFGEVINKMRTNDKELNPGWIETYLETLKNLGLPEPLSISDLRSLQKLLQFLNEESSQILQTNIDAFLKLLIHNGFNFQNLLKSAREPRKIKVIVEDEGSGSSEETMEEEDSPKLELLYQLFDDFIQLKRKLIDILSKLPLLIEMMDENNGEMNEQSTKGTKVQESTSLLSRKIQWIREKAQNITEILSQVPLLEYIRNLRDYLGQSSPAEMEELESEIEDLLKEFEESEEMFAADLDELDEVVNENLEIENYKSRDMSEEQTTQSIPEELETEETTTETNRKARKLFEKIITEEKEKNKDGEFVKVWRKTIKIFGKDEAKDQSKETSSDKDEKWKEEIYNKVFKGDTKNELIVDQPKVMKETQTNIKTENLSPAGETMKENIFEKIFGNKEEMKMGENEKEKEWKIKKT
ncbi:hypothetical protein Avbf_07865 [Armadillidium vulgare]|nr:hypothetical protein Avbf_07865 [Armadillidium vulgare]